MQIKQTVIDVDGWLIDYFKQPNPFVLNNSITLAYFYKQFFISIFDTHSKPYIPTF